MFCTQCGTEVPANSRFCGSCGASLTQSTPVAPRTLPGVTGRPLTRPRWVWVISGCYFFSIGWTLLSFALIFSGAISITPAQQRYFASLGILDYLSIIGVGLVNSAAAILLFRLRKGAVPAFGFAIVLNLSQTFIHLIAKNWAEAVGSSGLVSALLGLIIWASVFLYARRLRLQGVLA